MGMNGSAANRRGNVGVFHIVWSVDIFGGLTAASLLTPFGSSSSSSLELFLLQWLIKTAVLIAGDNKNEKLAVWSQRRPRSNIIFDENHETRACLSHHMGGCPPACSAALF